MVTSDTGQGLYKVLKKPHYVPELEFWLRKSGDIAITERNPCGCCYNDYNITDRPVIMSPARTTYIGHYSRRGLFKMMRSIGYTKLK